MFYGFLVSCFFCSATYDHSQKGWVSLFDGKTLTNWKVGSNAGTFTIEDGSIVAHGPTAHLFYDGDVHQHNFKNFEFKAEVMTTPGSNSGIYFHTTYQEKAGRRKDTRCRSIIHIPTGEEQEVFTGYRI